MAYEAKSAPYALTPEVHERLVAGVRLGAPLDLCCKYAGVGYSTVREWIAADKRGVSHPTVQALLAAMKEAEGQAAMVRLQRLYEHGKDVWQADAWWLERRYPEHFSRRVEITGREGGPITLAAADAIMAGDDDALDLPHKATLALPGGTNGHGAENGTANGHDGDAAEPDA